MAWVTSKTNGNVFPVEDEQVEYFKAQGHKVSDSDPREAKPRVAKKKG